MIQPCKVVTKFWGRELWIVNHPGPNGYCCKKLFVDAGRICSMHRHQVKNESFIVLFGSGFIELGDGAPICVEQGSVLDVPAGTWHRFWTKTGMTMLEVSSYHDDNDVERRAPSGKLRSSDRVVYEISL